MTDLEGSVEDLEAIWGVGRGMHKNHLDLRRYEQIIKEVRPNVVVETGLLYGGSMHWFAARVPHFITIDNDAASVAAVRADEHGMGPVPENAEIIWGWSTGHFPVIRKKVEALGGPVMVVLDSDHSTATVLGEMQRYGTIVTPGSYMVVEDGILAYTPRNWYEGNPLEAIEQFLPDHPEFQNDARIEGMFPRTQHPGGWLKRVS